MTADHNDPAYRLGLEEETPEEFLQYRRSWLADPGSVRLQRAAGGWDVVLRLDGCYTR